MGNYRMGWTRGRSMRHLIACAALAAAFGCEGRRPLVSDVVAPSAGGQGGEGGAGEGGEGGAGGDANDETAGGSGGDRSAADTCPAPRCNGEPCGALGDGSCEAPVRLFAPEPLEVGWLELVVTGDTRCGENEHSSASCAASGRELFFDLDLSGVSGSVAVWAEVEAEFDASVHIEHGQCADSVVVACNDDHADGVDRAVVAATLEPGRYRLVVDAEDARDAGEFSVSLLLRGEDAQCIESPSNDSCDGAIDLDPDLAVQTVVGSTRCAHNDAYSFFECHFDDATADVFFRLDLSGRDAPVVVRASTDLAPTDFDTTVYVMDSAQGHCFAAVACNDDGPPMTQSIDGASELVALLEPAEYFLVVDGLFTNGDFGLRVSLDEIECAGNVSCEDAMELDSSPGEHTFAVDTACATSTYVGECTRYDNGPDVYYRLDLSSYEGPVRVNAVVNDGDFWSLALGAEGADSSCGSELLCRDESLDAIVQPGVYYLIVSAPRHAAHAADVGLAIEPVGAGELADCVDVSMADCAEDYWSFGSPAGSCCDGPAAPCLHAASSCGLDPGLHACVCEAAPECCEPASSGRDCAVVFAGCGLFCEGFDLTAYCEGEP